MSDLVEDYELFVIPPRWMVLKIESKKGLVGWGEPIIEGRTQTTYAAVKELMDNYVLGKDPSRIEDIWQVLYRGGFYRGGPILMSALSGIDQALWDIKGKSFGVPIYELLGGAVRDKIKTYSWIAGDKPHNAAEDAIEKAKQGYTAFKMNVAGKLGYLDPPSKAKEIADRVESVREAIGQEFDIAVDFHGRVSKAALSRIVKKIEPFHPLFIEEPLIYSQPEELSKLKSKTDIPIALGERLYSRLDILPYLEERAVDILQPDLSHAGGITECHKIATMAEAYDVGIAFHCPLGPIALSACLQVDAVTRNAFIQEQSLGIHYNENIDFSDYIKNPEHLFQEKGYLKIPEKPGLGVEIDEESLLEVDNSGKNWKNPVWRRDDGSLAEW